MGTRNVLQALAAYITAAGLRRERHLEIGTYLSKQGRAHALDIAKRFLRRV